MIATPLVSVVVPVFNGADYLADALESALAQTYTPLDVIVVDDGSRDETAAVAGRFPSIRYEYQAHAGISAARNRGLSMARGDLFALLDADDLWLPGKVALQMAALREDPELDIVFGQVEEFVDPRSAATPALGGRGLPAPARGCIPSAMMVRRQAFWRVGPFDTAWRVGEFADWYLRATEAGLRARVLPEVVAKRRIHRTNQGIRRRDAAGDYVRIIKQSLDRRRRATDRRSSE